MVMDVEAWIVLLEVVLVKTDSTLTLVKGDINSKKKESLYPCWHCGARDYLGCSVPCDPGIDCVIVLGSKASKAKSLIAGIWRQAGEDGDRHGAR
jgi:hypothetical protein